MEQALTDTIDRIQAHDVQGQLASLKPVAPSQVAHIRAQYPAISPLYLAFIEQIGVGATTAGVHVYAPIPATQAADHPSAMLYNGPSAQALFGTSNEAAPLPRDAVMIADSGASWRYCLCPSVSDGVFVLDVAGPTLEIEAEDFATFACDTLILRDEVL